MFWLKVYIISTLICLALSTISLSSIAEQVKREGYKINEKVSRVVLIHKSLPLLIPGLNILVTIAFIFCSDDIISKVKAKAKIISDTPNALNHKI
jgi:hypothetical protein